MKGGEGAMLVLLTLCTTTVLSAQCLDGSPPPCRTARASVRAVQLDPGSSDAWLARGYVYGHEHPQTLAGVLEALDSATRLDPRNAEAWHQYGYFRWVMYQDSAALDAFGRAIDVDPTRGITLEHIARVHFYARRYEAARRWIDSALTVEPATPYFLLVRGRTELLLGEPDAARRDADQAAALSPDSATRLLVEITRGLIEIASGDSAAARRRAAALVAMFPDSGPIPYREGVWLAALSPDSSWRTSPTSTSDTRKHGAGRTAL